MMCPNCARWAPADPETGYDADTLCPDCSEEDAALEVEAQSVERIMTSQEIFAVGFKRGQALAGLASNAEMAYNDWLRSRL